MNNPIFMHINYAEVAGTSLGSKSLSDVCHFAADLGYEGIEFRGWLPKDFSGLTFREYVEKLAAAKKEIGDDFEIMFRFMAKGCASPKSEVRDAVVAEITENAKIVRELCGTKICNTTAEVKNCPLKTVPAPGYEFNGSAAANDETFNLTADTYSRIAKELEKIDLRFAFETHMGYIHDLPQPSRRLVDMIDSPMVGLNLDYGNMMLFPEQLPVEQVIDILGNKLYYVHLKNYIRLPESRFRLPAALGDGEINHRLYLEKLQAVGYTGPICLEAPRPGDRLWFAKNDFAYIKDVMANMA